jgi:hypothetical protein
MKFTQFVKLQHVFVLFIAVLSALPSQAQVLYGTLLGNVTSQDHSAIPGARATVTNAETGLRREVTTDERGGYSVRDLQPGKYEIRFDAKGFAGASREGVDVIANGISRADVSLSVEGQQQSVEVTAPSGQIQADSGDVHTEITAAQIENLPLAGYKNYQSLLNLVPGATPVAYQNSILDTPSRSLTTNINGTSRNSISTAVDGASIQQIYLPHHTLYNPPSDAIESVNVATNSFSAEQGLAGGAVITVITKSGTNAFHGTLSENHTNSDLAARNFFYLKNNLPLNLLNQFGGTLGGPVRKNKVFFFSSYEGVIQRQNFSTIVTVPLSVYRGGNFAGSSMIYDPATGNADGSGRSAFPGNIIPASRLSPAALKMLALVPTPNLGGNSSNLNASQNWGLDRHSIDEKGTWQIDSRSSLFGKFTYMDAKVNAFSTLGAGGGTGLIPGGGSGESHIQVVVIGTGYTRTLSPNVVVDGNFGFGRNVVTVFEKDYGTNYGSDVFGIPGTNGSDKNQSGLPSFAISGYETFGNPESYTPEIKHDNVFTYVSNVAWTKGAHTLRAGVQLLNNEMNEFQPQRGFGPRGGFTFNGGATSLKGGASASSSNTLADFLLGLPNTLGKSYQYDNPIIMHEWQTGVYAQDQWRATSKLTITYGVRWEYYPIPTRAANGLERYDFNTNNVIIGGIGGSPSGGGTYANWHQFAPRGGVAWRIDGKTVLRGGFGFTIDPYPISRALRDPYPVTIAQTISSISSFLPAGSFAKGIPPVAAVNIANGSVPLPIDAYTKTLNAGELTRGDISSYNATLERSLPLGMIGSVAYVGTRSANQMAYVEANAGLTAGTGAAAQPLYIAFNRTAQTQIIEPYNTAHYNSLQLYLKRPMARGLQFTAAYTWAKAIDYSTDSDNTPLFNTPAYASRNKAVSNFDRAQVFQTGIVAQSPFGAGRVRGAKDWKDTVLGGWKISATGSLYTGLPFTPTASGTSLNQPFDTQVADQIKPAVQTIGGIGPGAVWFDTSAYAPVSQARLGTAGRNSLRGPGKANMDLSISRQFAVTDRIRFDLRAEAFNLTNTPAFSNPATSVSSSSFGHITSTVGGAADSRVMRVSGKITF